MVSRDRLPVHLERQDDVTAGVNGRTSRDRRSVTRRQISIKACRNMFSGLGTVNGQRKKPKGSTRATCRGRTALGKVEGVSRGNGVRRMDDVVALSRFLGGHPNRWCEVHTSAGWRAHPKVDRDSLPLFNQSALIGRTAVNCPCRQNTCVLEGALYTTQT